MSCMYIYFMVLNANSEKLCRVNRLLQQLVNLFTVCSLFWGRHNTVCFCSGVSPEWRLNPKQIWFGQNKVASHHYCEEQTPSIKHPHPMNSIGVEHSRVSWEHSVLWPQKISSLPHRFHKRPSSQRMRQKCDKNGQCLCLNDGMQHMSTKGRITEGSLEQGVPCQHS